MNEQKLVAAILSATLYVFVPLFSLTTILTLADWLINRKKNRKDVTGK